MALDNELMRRFVAARSEDAFAELVRRHLNLVFSAALRQVNGDVHLAADVAQSVFTDLARKAPALANRPALTGWLYTSAHFAAAKAVRTEQRRRAREKDAFVMNELLTDPAPEIDWQKLRPAIDEVMHKLNERERDVLLMRYFENRPLADIGERLGLSEDAARKRVDRALEKLRGFLSKRGITTAGSLAAMLSAHAVQVAPAGLTASLTGASLAAAAGSTGSLAFLKVLGMTKLQTTTLGALLLASAITSVVIEQTAHAKISQIDSALQQQEAQLPALRAESDRLSNSLAWATQADQSDQLAKARAEVESLRAQTNDLGTLRAQHARLLADLKNARGAMMKNTNSQNTITSPMLRSKTQFAMGLTLAMWEYADAHNDHFPTNPSDALPYLPKGMVIDTNLSPDLFEIDYQGTRQSTFAFAHPSDVIMLAEKQPWLNIDGKWVKVWTSINTSGHALALINGDFDAWESQHIAEPPSPGANQ